MAGVFIVAVASMATLPQISLLVTEVATENACIPEAKSFLPVIVSMYKYSKSTQLVLLFSVCVLVCSSHTCQVQVFTGHLATVGCLGLQPIAKMHTNNYMYYRYCPY